VRRRPDIRRATTGEIDVLDAQLRLPQTMRVTLAADAQLPFGVVGTIEGLYTRARRPCFSRRSISASRSRPTARARDVRPSAPQALRPPRDACRPQLGDVISVTIRRETTAYDVTVALRRESRMADLSTVVQLWTDA
jgi:hypothetical protein